MKSILGVAIAVSLVLSACSDEPSTGEYADDVEALVGAMHVELDALDEEVARAASLEDVQTYFAERRALRDGFLADFKTLEPSTETADLHETAIGILERLMVAEGSLADRVQAATTVDELGDPWATPEGEAARAADAESVALCRAVEERFDESRETADLAGVPWVPAEMKDIIVIVLGCVPEER